MQIPGPGAEVCPRLVGPEHHQATAPCAGPDRARHTEMPPLTALPSNELTDYWPAVFMHRTP